MPNAYYIQLTNLLELVAYKLYLTNIAVEM